MDKLELKPITLAALAAITGIFAAALALAITWLAGYPKPWIYAVLGWAIVSMLSWFALMRRYLAIIAGDQDFNNEILKPSKIYPTSTRVEIISRDPANEFSAGKFSDLPVDLPTLIKVAKWIDNGADFSMAGLSGRYRPLTRSQFESLRDTMIQSGLAFWIDPDHHAQGCKLTRGGAAMIKHFATYKPGFTTAIPQQAGMSRRRDNSPSKTRARGRAGGNGRREPIRHLAD